MLAGVHGGGWRQGHLVWGLSGHESQVQAPQGSGDGKGDSEEEVTGGVTDPH
jgi:hypothetical protein